MYKNVSIIHSSLIFHICAHYQIAHQLTSPNIWVVCYILARLWFRPKCKQDKSMSLIFIERLLNLLLCKPNSTETIFYKKLKRICALLGDNFFEQDLVLRQFIVIFFNSNLRDNYNALAALYSKNKNKHIKYQ